MAAALASPALTSINLQVTHLLKHCFEKSRTTAGEFIARLWWKWHTPHVNLGKPDLGTCRLLLGEVDLNILGSNTVNISEFCRSPVLLGLLEFSDCVALYG